ncbi:MAG TPA: DUF362 domain-containing protein [Bacteroidetes bacterium]|nr:DUF362 domain-containing protein [Bacteroidota bacterium]
MSKVVYFTNLRKLGEALDNFNMGSFSGKRYPLKLHMGETGNRYYPKANFVKLVVEELKNRGGEPFLFDTTVAYPGLRHYKSGYQKVARMHGFRKIDCDVVIDDAGKNVKIEGRDYEVADNIYRSKHIFALSHVKGHIATGFGGAIKNFGMGGVTKETKKKMHHASRPVYQKDACNFCGVCAEVCPFDAIKVNDKRWALNKRKCFGCGVCIENCNRKAITNEDKDLPYLLACAAKACVDNKNVIYLNDVNRISRNCDCDPLSGPIICPDIGYLISDDIVAIDQASVDLVNNVKKDIFLKKNKVDPEKQIKYGEEIGLGSTSYELIEI